MRVSGNFPFEETENITCPNYCWGNPSYLSCSEKDLGYESHCLTLSQTQYHFYFDECVLNGNEGIIFAEIKTIYAALKAFFTTMFIIIILVGAFSQCVLIQIKRLSKWKIFLHKFLFAFYRTFRS